MVAMDALRAAHDVIILWDMRACATPGINKATHVKMYRYLRAEFVMLEK
jgi:hypothetical protein